MPRISFNAFFHNSIQLLLLLQLLRILGRWDIAWSWLHSWPSRCNLSSLPHILRLGSVNPLNIIHPGSHSLLNSGLTLSEWEGEMPRVGTL